MSELLEQRQFSQRDSVSDVQVGRGRIDAEVHPQRALLAQRVEQPFAQLALHRRARLLVAVGGAAHDQPMLTFNFGEKLRIRLFTHRVAPAELTWGRAASKSRAASRSRPICARAFRNLYSSRLA